jgi:hypothetical protein
MADLIVEDGTIVTGANSYCTADEADLYFEKRLHTTVWDDADPDDKEKALMWASRLLDEQVVWSGWAVSDSQPMRFPRDGLYNSEGDEVGGALIPLFLKDAVSEFALHLLSEDRTLDTNRDLIGLKRVRIDTVEIEAENSILSKPVIPSSVWSIIKNYGRAYGSRRRLVRA